MFILDETGVHEKPMQLPDISELPPLDDEPDLEYFSTLHWLSVHVEPMSVNPALSLLLLQLTVIHFCLLWVWTVVLVFMWNACLVF